MRACVRACVRAYGGGGGGGGNDDGGGGGGGGGGDDDDDDDDDFLVPLTVHGELPDSLGCCSSSAYGAGQHCGGSTMIG